MPHCYLTDLSSALSAHWRSIRACAQMCDTILRNKKVDMVIYGYVGLQQFRFWFLTDKLDWSIVLSLTLLLKLADAEVFKLWGERGRAAGGWGGRAVRRRHCERRTGGCPCSGNNRKLVVVAWPTDLAHSLTQSASAAVTQLMGAIKAL